MNHCKGFIAKYGITQKTANAFIRAARGGTSGSIMKRLREAFGTHGRPVPGDRSVREHCIAEAPFIRQLGKDFKAPSAVRIATTKVAGQPAASDAFLLTYEWRRVRMVALKRYGARCQCCGAGPADGAVMNVDHIKPRRLFPELALDIENLQVLCNECNHGKGNWDQTDWRTPEAPSDDAEQRAHLRAIIGGKS